MKNDKRSPLKAKPLRNPGQSLDEQLDELIYDKFTAPLLMVVVLLMLTCLEWWRYYYSQKPNPYVYSFAVLLVIGYATFQIWRAWPRLSALKQGRDGEKVVGQFLERMRETGYQVFHDVVGTGFNVDHVLIGPAGAFTIETKTYSKRPSADAKVTFDGERIVVDGHEPDRDPVVQAKGQARWLRELLAESTGRKFAVRPVIVFPGWWVEQSTGSTREVWVLEPKALPAFIAHQPEILAAEDVQLASYHLAQFIRARERERAGG